MQFDVFVLWIRFLIALEIKVKTLPIFEFLSFCNKISDWLLSSWITRCVVQRRVADQFGRGALCSRRHREQ